MGTGLNRNDKNTIPTREDRVGNYIVDLEFETFLNTINCALSTVEKEVTFPSLRIEKPILFICYAPRAGSTLIAQSLARTGFFSYISNFSARFWKAPTVALMLEKKLGLRSNLKNKLWENDYGVTTEIDDPHEFGFFWNQIIDKNTTSKANILSADQKNRLRTQISAMVSVFEKPFVFKNGIAGYNVELMADLFPNAFFLHITRDVVMNAQSILIGREKMFGDIKKWFSLIPEDVEEILAKAQDEYEEVLLQVAYINRDIQNSIKKNNAKCLKWKYENFCINPKDHIAHLLEWMKIKHDKSELQQIPKTFAVSNIKHPVFHQRLNRVWEKIKKIEV